MMEVVGVRCKNCLGAGNVLGPGDQSYPCPYCQPERLWQKIYQLVSQITTLADVGDWRLDVEDAPRDRLLEVCGDSGYVTHTQFLALAYRPLTGEGWRDVQGDWLLDCGWTPYAWRYPRPLPPSPTFGGKDG